MNEGIQRAREGGIRGTRIMGINEGIQAASWEGLQGVRSMQGMQGPRGWGYKGRGEGQSGKYKLRPH